MVWVHRGGLRKNNFYHPPIILFILVVNEEEGIEYMICTQAEITDNQL